MLFTFPEDARWNAERQAVEFGVEIGEYQGVVRVPWRAFQRLLPEPPSPERCIEAYYRDGLSAVERPIASRRAIATTWLKITQAVSISPANPVREHRRAEDPPAPVDRGRERGDHGA